MALTDENGGNGFYMPVAPAYGGGQGGFGGDSWCWLILLLLFAGGGWGMGGYGGYGNMQLGMDFPWLLNGQNGINNNVSSGFRDAQLSDGITSIRDGIGNLSTQLCNCCGDMQQAVSNGFAQAEIAANGRQMANMQQAFNAQTAVQQGFGETRLANCQTQNVIQSEGSATRFADANNTRDIIEAQTRGTQQILDKLCALELDNVKAQYAAEQRENANLRSELMYARGQASQNEQNAFIAQGFANEVDALYNRLNSCPVPTTPVYGRTPIFQCNNNGCGCNG